MDEREVNDKLKEGLDISPEMVYAVKDNKALEDSVMGIVKTIFDMSSLSDIEKDILRNLAIVPFSGIELKVFKELAGYSRDSEIFRLRERGLVTMEEVSRRVSLHPLISEAIFNYDTTKPSEESCRLFLTNLSAKLENTVLYSLEWHDLNKTRIRFAFKRVQPIIPYLKDEYRSGLRFLNKFCVDYLNNDLSKLSQMRPLSELISLKSYNETQKTFIAKVELFEHKKDRYYISVPTELSKPLEHLADRGLIAVTAKVGNSSWPTSMSPMDDGTHFIALPVKVFKKEKLLLGMAVEVSFEIRA